VKYLFLIFFSLLSISCKHKTEDSKPTQFPITKNSTSKSGFHKLSSSKSGIKFNNKITHNIATRFNLFDYDYFYNGAGVGIEDFNNDGLKDIFFCGNQVENKLYLNKGDLVFEDISETANINVNKYWSNGVSFVDINNDGWIDIYVSQGGPYEKNKRKNLLYINQKNLTFTEEASKYGLDDSGIGTQTAFFDYDKDGDLDCIVMNENELYGTDPITFHKILKNKQLLKDNSSHFYRNDSGKFNDITEKAGLLKPTFGLGLCVSDINNDNWLDIYIANDYYLPDAMYINNHNGSFNDKIKETTNQISFYGMGLDIEDINNDNLNDIFVLDMASSDHVRSKKLMASMNVSKFDLLVDKLKFQHQYMFNSLQLNLGNDKFHNVIQSTDMAKTDWSWSALIFDFNNNSFEDLYVTNGYRRYALDNDSQKTIIKMQRAYNGKVPLTIKEELYNSLPSEKLPNILFKNSGHLNFENVTAFSELNEPSFSNGAAYSDLDNDGDLDIVVNNMDDEAFIFENNTNNNNNYLKIETKGAVSEDFAKVKITFNGKTKTKESKRVRGYLSSIDKTIHFGLGKVDVIDTLMVTWQSGKYQELYNVKSNTTLILQEKDASKTQITSTEKRWFKKLQKLISFNHKENNYNDFEKEILLPYKQSTIGPFISKGDINGDAKDDFFIGGASGQASALFIQTDTGYKKSNIEFFEKEAKYEDMEALFIDIDNDSDNDLYIVGGGSEFREKSSDLKDRIYLNDGNGVLSKTENDQLSYNLLNGKTITKIDYDKDGDDDIIIGNRIRPQKYPLNEPSIIYRNDNGKLTNVTKLIAPSFENFGMINKMITTDFNNDGWEDFIAIGEWTPIGLFQNNKGVFEDISLKSNLKTQRGWWLSVHETDINNDGLNDYVLGNIGTNIKFKATTNKPLSIYADDVDYNGTHDVILSKMYNGTPVPVRGRECSSQQMPFISKKIPSYNEFANSSIIDIYGTEIMNKFKKEANQFKSILLINKGDSNFKIMELPKLAQTMPILGIDSYDFNDDGFNDIIIAGNIYNTEVETPRLDNPFALVLQSNKKDGYTTIKPEKTGLYLKGKNIKDVKILNHKKLNKTFALFATNNDRSPVFELQK